MDGNFVAAAVAIYIAMVLDGLDGRVARMTSTESEFGKQYDSLADMVSFGLAPALVFYLWGVKQLAELGWLWGKLGWLVAFFFAVAAALRLARYNSRVGTADKRYFEGLPSPSAAADRRRAGVAEHRARGLRRVRDGRRPAGDRDGRRADGQPARVLQRQGFESRRTHPVRLRAADPRRVHPDQPEPADGAVPAVFRLLPCPPRWVSLWRLLRRRQRRLARDDEPPGEE
jgi:CDP-diacylglycerol--serine O-phosphatidyltransferase